MGLEIPLHVSKELTQRQIERHRDPEHVHQGNIPLASLDITHIRAVNAGQVSQRFLADSLGLTGFPHGFAKRPF
jgi:hypothetical protein